MSRLTTGVRLCKESPGKQFQTSNHISKYVVKSIWIAGMRKSAPADLSPRCVNSFFSVLAFSFSLLSLSSMQFVYWSVPFALNLAGDSSHSLRRHRHELCVIYSPGLIWYLKGRNRHSRLNFVRMQPNRLARIAYESLSHYQARFCVPLPRYHIECLFFKELK